MLQILAVGEFTGNLVGGRELAASLGPAIVERDHTLLTLLENPFGSALAPFGLALAQAANEALGARGQAADARQRIVSYYWSDEPSSPPPHRIGTVLRLHVDWWLGSHGLRVPEPIKRADVVVLAGIGKGRDIHRIANWARIQHKPVLAIARFGGAAEAIYRQERDAFERKYLGMISEAEFESLADAASSSEEYSRSIISVAEGVCKLAFAIVPFSSEHDGTYRAIQEACQGHYECRRISEEHRVQRTRQAIRDRIRGCALAVVDISSASPNVYFELGFTEAVGQKFIMIAKVGTELPFDVDDAQVLFWRDHEDLIAQLRQRIETRQFLIPAETPS